MKLTERIQPITKPIIALTLGALLLTAPKMIQPVKAEEIVTYKNLGQCVETCVKDPAYTNGLSCVLDCKAGEYQPTPTGLQSGSICTADYECSSNQCVKATNEQISGYCN